MNKCKQTNLQKRVRNYQIKNNIVNPHEIIINWSTGYDTFCHETDGHIIEFSAEIFRDVYNKIPRSVLYKEENKV